MLDIWTGCSGHLPLTAGDACFRTPPSMKPNRAVFQQGNAAAAISREHTWKTNRWAKRKKSKRRQEKIHKQRPESNCSTYMPEKRLDIAKRRGENGGCSKQWSEWLQPCCHGILGMQREKKNRGCRIAGPERCSLSLLGCCRA